MIVHCRSIGSGKGLWVRLLKHYVIGINHTQKLTRLAVHLSVLHTGDGLAQQEKLDLGEIRVPGSPPSRPKSIFRKVAGGLAVPVLHFRPIFQYPHTGCDKLWPHGRFPPVATEGQLQANCGSLVYVALEMEISVPSG